MGFEPHRQPSVANGNPDAQMLIRRWWREECGSQGEIVWEYHVQGFYADAIRFQDSPNHGAEHPGLKTAVWFPVAGRAVVLCEAKVDFTPALIGQGRVHRSLLQQAGAMVARTILFAATVNLVLERVAKEYGLEVIYGGTQPPKFDVRRV